VCSRCSECVYLCDKQVFADDSVKETRINSSRIHLKATCPLCSSVGGRELRGGHARGPARDLCVSVRRWQEIPRAECPHAARPPLPRSPCLTPIPPCIARPAHRGDAPPRFASCVRLAVAGRRRAGVQTWTVSAACCGWGGRGCSRTRPRSTLRSRFTFRAWRCSRCSSTGARACPWRSWGSCWGTSWTTTLCESSTCLPCHRAGRG
jgi:hypothetical protein